MKEKAIKNFGIESVLSMGYMSYFAFAYITALRQKGVGYNKAVKACSLHFEEPLDIGALSQRYYRAREVFSKGNKLSLPKKEDINYIPLQIAKLALETAWEAAGGDIEEFNLLTFENEKGIYHKPLA